MRVLLFAALSVIVLLIPVYIGQGLPWQHAIAAAVIVVVPGAALVTFVWRIELQHKARSSLPSRVLRAVLFSGAWITAIIAMSYLVHPAAATAFLQKGAVWQLIGGLVLYMAVAARAQTQIVKSALKEQELAATRLELNALQAQLNPHFLFNTLHALTQLAKEDMNATEQALQQFGDLMRYVLQAGRNGYEDVSLEDELTFVRNYLKLEQIRFNSRLLVEEQVEPDCLEMGVPPLLLQPLVENAVCHGIAPMPEGGTITILARLHAENMILEVRDTGHGAYEKEWQATEGVGLGVVRRQIETRFPATGRFEVLASPGSGFIARVQLPLFLPERAGR